MTRMIALGAVGLVLLVACSGGGGKHSSAPPSTLVTGRPKTPPSSVPGSTLATIAVDPTAQAIVAGKGKVDADVVVVALDTLKFDQPQYSGKADLTIGYLNAGVQEHHLRIEGNPDFGLVVTSQGASKVADIKLQRRTYTIYCDRPGHRQAGMEATLVIP
jgi:plastocyanin